MSMNMNGIYNYAKAAYAKAGCAKQAKTGVPVDKAEKAQGAGKDTDGIKGPDQHDEYVDSKKAGRKPNGLYRLGQDENGRRKIFYDDPKKNSHAAGKEQAADSDAPKKSGNAAGKGQPSVNLKRQQDADERCIADTDKVDREIRELKEKKEQLEQQVRSASGDEKKVRELEKKLAQVENELKQKDNDTYRRQHTSFTKQ